MNGAGTQLQAYELDVLGMTGTEKLIQSGALTNNVAVTKIAASGATLDVTGAFVAANALTLGVTGADTGTSDKFTINFDDQTKAPAGGAIADAANVVLNDIETVNIVSGGAASHTNTLTYASAENSRATASSVAQTLDISGDKALTLNVETSGVVVNTQFVVDAGDLTGKLTMTGTSTGLDYITKIVGGSADDTLFVGDRATAVDLSKGGNDKVDIGNAVAMSNIDAHAVSITGASSGDVIVTGIANGGATAGTLGAAKDLGASATMAQILDTLADAANKSAQKAAWAHVNGTTYLVIDTDGTTAVAGDEVVTLTGVTSLANAALADGTGGVTDMTITLA